MSMSCADGDSEGGDAKAEHSEAARPALAVEEAAQAQGVEHMSLAEARSLLDKDHYGLDKVKTCSLVNTPHVAWLLCVSVASALSS